MLFNGKSELRNRRSNFPKNIMARPLRLEAERAVCHVIARSNERKAVFRDDRDRQEYLAG